MINPVKDFEEAYKDLNPAQKEAVDTLDGPVLVVAGPGTGKTQVLSIRIANILKKTDTGASGMCFVSHSLGLECALCASDLSLTSAHLQGR
jgi:superfamily II DNA or RNA helicase